MATLPNTRLTLADLLKYMGPDGGVAPVLELLAQRNECMMDPVFQPGNLPTGHQFSVRTALPTAYLRDYNEGVAPSKSAVAQQTEGMCIVEAWSEVDAAEAKLNGNESAFRAQEDKAFIESMEQQFVQQMFYGNVRTDPKAVNGLITRIGVASHPQFIDCGGTGSDNTSIVLAQWGDGLFGIYPKGSMAGLQAENHGKQIIQFSDGKRMLALVSQFVWNFGFVQRDYRTTVRIGNIDVSDLRTRTGTQELTDSTNIIYAMHDALYKLPDAGGKKVFYMNRTVHSALSKIAMDKSNNVLAMREGLDQFGRPYSWLDFNGAQLRCVDRLLNAEARVI
jgi:hypothetical protein